MTDSTGRSLRFSWEWDSAPTVRAPELAATWARLTVGVDDIIATLVEERGASHDLRKSMDVPTYPLAEWLALNWWKLHAPARRPGDDGVNLADAGDGFAWPDMTLRTDRETVWIELRRRDRDPDHVRFLSAGRAVVELDEAVAEVAAFIDSTCRRLEAADISGTLLQQEWSAIQDADPDEAEFCTVAAAWGFDPYNVPVESASALIKAAEGIGDVGLLAELAAVADLSAISEAEHWFSQARTQIRLGPTLAGGGLMRTYRAGYSRPWIEGYDGARQLRSQLHLDPSATMSVEDFVDITDTESQPPERVVGLVRIGGDAAGLVVPSLPPHARRFAAARAIGRLVTSPSNGLSVMTSTGRYLEQVERAFAAELLAPAAGIKELAGGKYSDKSIEQVAQKFSVSPVVVHRQIENQIFAAA